jgi:hypothetical protein
MLTPIVTEISRLSPHRGPAVSRPPAPSAAGARRAA